MIWDFFKKRWFSVALILIVLIAIFRKNLRVNVGDTAAPAAKEQREKYTGAASAARSASLLQLGGDGAAPTAVELPEIDDATAMAFFKRFGQAAVAEQQKFGIPASVILANAYVNSFAGRRDCATTANNFAGLRCSADWGGPVATISGVCFRKYNTAWESLRDFNLYLSRRDWFANTRKTAGAEWRGWTRALAEHHLSDVTGYEAGMDNAIRRFRLAELD